MDKDILARTGHSVFPNTHDERPHGCISGVVYIGHMLEDDSGEEVEVFDAVPCRRCSVGEDL